jgi:multidrug efflux pump subunit AcrB
VKKAIEADSVAPVLGGGRLGQSRPLLDAGSGARSLEDLANLTVHAVEGRTIAVRDVAIVQDGYAATPPLVRLDGKRVVCLPILAARSDREFLDEIRARLKRIEAMLPAGTQLRYLPCQDPDSPAEITAYLRAASNLPLEAVEKRVAAFEQFVEQVIPAIERVWVLSECGVGQNASAIYTHNSAPEDATVRIRLRAHPSKPASDYVVLLRERSSNNQDVTDMSARFHLGPMTFSAWERGNLADLEIRVSGADSAARAEARAAVMERLAHAPGVAAAQIDERLDTPFLSIDVDRSKAAGVGMTAADIFRQAADILGGTSSIGRASWFDAKTGRRFPIVVAFADEPHETLEDLLNARLMGSEQGVPVPLAALAAMRRSQGPGVIHHIDGTSVLHVLIDAAGPDVDRVAGQVRKAIADTPAPAGVSLDVHRPGVDARP